MATKEQHINQKVVGYIKIGNAGLTKDDIKRGYVCHICTIDKDNRFVDIATTKDQLQDMSDQIIHTLSLLEEG